MPERTDITVIGAGVIGLAVAREFARAGREVVVLEREGAIGTGISARNSEVIHAGLYYPTGSLKARLCVEGRRMLYEYCASRKIAYRRCGKLVAAVSAEQLPALESIYARATANDVEDVKMLSAEEARALEPALNCAAALHSPVSGIIDSHGLMLSLLGEAQDHGASVAFHAAVESIRPRQGGFRIRVGGPAATEIDSGVVINCAGLGAWDVARAVEGFPDHKIPPRHYAKGTYFSLSGRTPFSRLIYPLPEPGGLGVHLTLDMAGRGRFGPDVEWVDALDYAADPARGKGFYEAIRAYWPGLPDGALQADYTGIRPKISGPGQEAADFLIQGADDHGMGALINLFGIESPGLTSCLALGLGVKNML